MDVYIPTLTVAGVLGFLAPLVSTAINRLTWPAHVKQIVAVVVSAVLAVMALLVTGGFTARAPGQDPVVYWLLVAFAVIAVSQLAYALVWKPTGVDAKLAVVTSSAAERATFVNQNTIPGETVVDSTATQTADAVTETDATPPSPDYTARHSAQ